METRNLTTHKSYVVVLYFNEKGWQNVQHITLGAALIRIVMQCNLILMITILKKHESASFLKASRHCLLGCNTV
jgi:hypothetical protein